mmetsp:Transcript_25419/g.64800  ORF Transcript_25419/g.64800 Transcript_25419/m.64800 type:complete len:210 (+) Transcript_25419:795-1424(+)
MLSDSRDLESLLHDIAGALLLGKVKDVPLHHPEDRLLILHPAMLQHVLDHVVAVVVCSERVNAPQDGIQHVLQLVGGAMLEQALDDAATVHVGGHALSLFLHRLDDEGNRVGRHLLDALLDDVVAVHAFDARDDVLLQLLCNEHLRLPRHVLDGLLNDAATMCLVGEVNELGEECLHQVLALVDGTDVEKLLDDEVAEWVAAQVDELRG